MNVDVSSLHKLFFFLREVELLIQFLSQVSLDEGTLSRDKRAIEVSVLTVTQEEHRISFTLDRLKGFSVGILVVSILLISLPYFREIFVKSLNYIPMESFSSNISLIIKGTLNVPFDLPKPPFRVLSISSFSGFVDSYLNLVKAPVFTSAIFLNNVDFHSVCVC